MPYIIRTVPLTSEVRDKDLNLAVAVEIEVGMRNTEEMRTDRIWCLDG
jgi:hypothetical protein